MYAMTLDPVALLSSKAANADTAHLSFERLCPYMTQRITVKLYPDAETMPVANWQLAKQLTDAKQNNADLRYFRFEDLNNDRGWTVPKLLIEDFSSMQPGRLLLLTANLRRGLGDLLMVFPAFQALSNRLKEIGWDPQFAISTNREFIPLFYGKDYVLDLLPEFPTITELNSYDYVLEFGVHPKRMRTLANLKSWTDTDLRIRLDVPPKLLSHWQSRLHLDQKKIFVNWRSFDRQRTLDDAFYFRIQKKYPDAAYFTSAFRNEQPGELFPGGPINLWPEGKSLLDLAAILANMDVVITTNTGAAHVAAALGIPTITLFTGRLYGWSDYWPNYYHEFYPTMYPIGLSENFDLLELSPEEMQDKIMEKLGEIISENVDS